MDKVNQENNFMSEINQAIDGKNNLPFEVQSDIKNLLSILVQVFELDSSMIADKLKKLEICKMPLYGDYENILVRNNRILVNPKAILNSPSGKSIYVQGILKYLYPNKATGVNALYNGTIEMASNAVVGDSNTSDEFAMCDILSKVMEPDLTKPEPLMSALFSENIASCLIKLQEKGATEEEISKLMSLANQNYMTAKFRKKSNLASIEKILIEIKLRQNPTKEEINDFTESLRINSELYGDKKNEYIDLDTLKSEYEQKVSSYLDTKEHIKTK